MVMKTWDKLSPVLWPVIGAIIILTFMVVATKLAWQPNGTTHRKVAQTAKRGNDDQQSVDGHDTDLLSSEQKDDDKIDGQGRTDTISGGDGNDDIKDPLNEINEAFTIDVQAILDGI